jgi:hypothetical protein
LDTTYSCRKTRHGSHQAVSQGAHERGRWCMLSHHMLTMHGMAEQSETRRYTARARNDEVQHTTAVFLTAHAVYNAS